MPVGNLSQASPAVTLPVVLATEPALLGPQLGAKTAKCSGPKLRFLRPAGPLFQAAGAGLVPRQLPTIALE